MNTKEQIEMIEALQKCIDFELAYMEYELQAKYERESLRWLKSQKQRQMANFYRLFKPREGYKFVQYDLSGIEAALIALYSGDKRLFEILEKGESIHDHNAKLRVF